MSAFITGDQCKTETFESQSKDSFEGDIDGIVVGGVGLNMVDPDTLPGGGHGLVLEDKVNPSVESVKVALVSIPRSYQTYNIGMGGPRSFL